MMEADDDYCADDVESLKRKVCELELQLQEEQRHLQEAASRGLELLEENQDLRQEVHRAQSPSGCGRAAWASGGSCRSSRRPWRSQLRSSYSELVDDEKQGRPSETSAGRSVFSDSPQKVRKATSMRSAARSSAQEFALTDLRAENDNLEEELEQLRVHCSMLEDKLEANDGAERVDGVASNTLSTATSFGQPRFVDVVRTVMAKARLQKRTDLEEARTEAERHAAEAEDLSSAHSAAKDSLGQCRERSRHLELELERRQAQLFEAMLTQQDLEKDLERYKTEVEELQKDLLGRVAAARKASLDPLEATGALRRLEDECLAEALRRAERRTQWHRRRTDRGSFPKSISTGNGHTAPAEPPRSGCLCCRRRKVVKSQETE